jgi:hypothetical protein
VVCKLDDNGTWGTTGESLKLSSPPSSPCAGSEGGLCGAASPGLRWRGDLAGAGAVRRTRVLSWGAPVIIG